MDLFEHYHLLPENIQQIIAETEIEDYQDCEKFLNKLEPLGYTFEYYLDAQPFNLTRI